MLQSDGLWKGANRTAQRRRRVGEAEAEACGKEEESAVCGMWWERGWGTLGGFIEQYGFSRPPLPLVAHALWGAWEIALAYEPFSDIHDRSLSSVSAPASLSPLPSSLSDSRAAGLASLVDRIERERERVRKINTI